MGSQQTTARNKLRIEQSGPVLAHLSPNYFQNNAPRDLCQEPVYKIEQHLCTNKYRIIGIDYEFHLDKNNGAKYAVYETGTFNHIDEFSPANSANVYFISDIVIEQKYSGRKHGSLYWITLSMIWPISAEILRFECDITNPGIELYQANFGSDRIFGRIMSNHSPTGVAGLFTFALPRLDPAIFNPKTRASVEAPKAKRDFAPIVRDCAVKALRISDKYALLGYADVPGDTQGFELKDENISWQITNIATGDAVALPGKFMGWLYGFESDNEPFEPKGNEFFLAKSAAKNSNIFIYRLIDEPR